MGTKQRTGTNSRDAERDPACSVHNLNRWLELPHLSLVMRWDCQPLYQFSSS